MDTLLWTSDRVYLSCWHLGIWWSTGRRSWSGTVNIWKYWPQNNMKESLMVFEQICNSKWFSRTSMILFLNKIDLFQAKLKFSSVSSYFPDFKGTLIQATPSHFLRRRQRLPCNIPLLPTKIYQIKQILRKRSLRSFHKRYGFVLLSPSW
jgi:hypothetical protein